MKTYTFNASRTYKAGVSRCVVHVEASNAVAAEVKAKASCKRGYELSLVSTLSGTLSDNLREGRL